MKKIRQMTLDPLSSCTDSRTAQTWRHHVAHSHSCAFLPRVP